MTTRDDPYITGGLVRISQRKRLGDFEHREVEVSLNFSTGIGEVDEILDRATGLAQAKVDELQAGKTPTPTRGPGRPPGAKNKPKDEEARGGAASTSAASPVQAPADPAAVTDDAQTVVSPETIDDVVGIETPPAPVLLPVSDADLKQYISAAMGKLVGAKDPQAAAKIKATIYQFTPNKAAPDTASMIALDQRRPFLAALAAL